MKGLKIAFCPFCGCQNEGRPLANDHPEGPYDGLKLPLEIKAALLNVVAKHSKSLE